MTTRDERTKAREQAHQATLDAANRDKATNAQIRSWFRRGNPARRIEHGLLAWHAFKKRKREAKEKRKKEQKRAALQRRRERRRTKKKGGP